jgi:hypothetical protein
MNIACVPEGMVDEKNSDHKRVSDCVPHSNSLRYGRAGLFGVVKNQPVKHFAAAKQLTSQPMSISRGHANQTAQHVPRHSSHEKD